MLPLLSPGVLGRLATSASSQFVASLGTATRNLSTASSDLKEAFAAQIPVEQVMDMSCREASSGPSHIIVNGLLRDHVFPGVLLDSMITLLQARLKAIKKAHGAQKLGDVTVDMAIGGMRGITVGMTYNQYRTHGQNTAAMHVMNVNDRHSPIHRACCGTPHCWTLMRASDSVATPSPSCR